MLATMLGVIVVIVFFIATIIIIAVVAESQKKISIKYNSVLKLTFDQPIVEREKPNPLEELKIPGFEAEETGIVELRQVLHSAMKDKRIKGILLDVSDIEARFSQLEPIRRMLEKFKTSGKFILAYGNYFAENTYYLSSVADQIILNPMGTIEFNGLTIEMLFYKGLFDKLEIKPQLFQCGDYKSFAEPFVRDSMSEPNREQLNAIIQSIYQTVLNQISESRKLSVENLREMSDSLLVRDSKMAKKYGLVDHIAYRDEMENILCEKLGSEPGKKINYVGYRQYKKMLNEKPEKYFKNKVAVIFAQGGINTGKGDNETIGSESLTALLRKAREDKNVKAIVLRVNSPGGSALASDVIWREVQLTREIKPVIASMSDLAASGGYYISMGCDKIIAERSTLTGSIGVIGLLVNAKDFLNNKLGVTSDKVKTGAYSDMGMFTRPLSSQEINFIQEEMNDIYGTFTRKAAQGRNMVLDSIRKIAQGRVWTGSQALEIGLVDSLGGLPTAIRVAAKMAKLGKNYRIQYLPVLKDPITKLLTGDTEESAVRLVYSLFGEWGKALKSLKDLEKFEGIQARLPWDIYVR